MEVKVKVVYRFKSTKNNQVVKKEVKVTKQLTCTINNLEDVVVQFTKECLKSQVHFYDDVQFLYKDKSMYDMLCENKKEEYRKVIEKNLYTSMSTEVVKVFAYIL